MPTPPSVLADPPSARTIRFALSRSASRTASPRPAEEAESGAGVSLLQGVQPAGVGDFDDGGDPVEGDRGEVAFSGGRGDVDLDGPKACAASAAATLPSPPSASGSPS